MTTTRRQNLLDRLTRINRSLIALDSPLRLGMSIWSPGDGWTRYALESLDQGRAFTPAMTVAQMEDTLTTIENLLWHGFDPRARRS